MTFSHRKIPSAYSPSGYATSSSGPDLRIIDTNFFSLRSIDTNFGKTCREVQKIKPLSLVLPVDVARIWAYGNLVGGLSWCIQRIFLCNPFGDFF